MTVGFIEFLWNQMDLSNGKKNIDDDSIYIEGFLLKKKSSFNILTVHFSLVWEDNFASTAWRIYGESFLEALLDIRWPHSLRVRRRQVLLVLENPSEKSRLRKMNENKNKKNQWMKGKFFFRIFEIKIPLNLKKVSAKKKNLILYNVA